MNSNLPTPPPPFYNTRKHPSKESGS